MDRTFISAAAEGRKVYWLTEQRGLGMCLDIDSKEVTLLNIPWKNTGIMPYGNSVLAVENGVLYGICCNGRYLAMFDILKKEIKTIEVGRNSLLLHDHAFAVKCKDNISILPYKTDRIIYINTKNGRIREVSVSPEAKTEKRDFYYAGFHEVIDPYRLPLFHSNRNELVIKNMISNGSEYYSYSGEIEKPLYIQEIDTGYYILTFSGDTYYLEKKSGNVKCIYEHVPAEGDGDIPFCTFTVKNDRLWLLPCFSERIIYVDIPGGCVHEFTDKPADLIYCGSPAMSNYTRAVYVEGATYFAMHTGNYLFSVDDSGEGRFLDLKWPSEYEGFQQLFNISGRIIEGKEKLRSFLKYVIQN